MRRMLTEKYLPKNLSLTDLDEYLAKGWYRLGPQIFTCQYLFFENKLFSPVWIRLPLKDYQFRKRLRKNWKKNNDKFKIEIGPFQMNEEKEDLYIKYKANFNGRLSPTMSDYLFNEADSAIFESMETRIYDDEKLIATSVFDLGKNSISSIIAIYDPDYSSYSLGFFTMLLEMDFGMRNGYEFYYPGYIVPGHPKFDYKLKIGKPDEVEYFNIRTKSWKIYTEFKDSDIPSKTVTDQLYPLRDAIKDVGIDTDVLFFPSFEPKVADTYNVDSKDSPIFLSCFSNFFISPRVMIFYDFVNQTYLVYQSISESPGMFEWSDAVAQKNDADLSLEFLSKRQLIISTSEIEEIIDILVALDMNRPKFELRNQNPDIPF